MDLFVRRFIDKKESTVGYMLMDGIFSAFTLEDQHQPDNRKVKKETRIPAGRYTLGFRQDPTPLTMKYRSKYDFFTWHIQIKDVKNFDSVYIHVGNYDEHTEGCLLIGLSVDTVYGGSIEDMIGNSVKAYKSFYGKVKAAFDKGEAVKLTIVDN